MVKEKKFFRRQAEKAEQAAGRTADPERAEGLRALATAFQPPGRGHQRKDIEAENEEEAKAVRLTHEKSGNGCSRQRRAS